MKPPQKLRSVNSQSKSKDTGTHIIAVCLASFNHHTFVFLYGLEKGMRGQWWRCRDSQKGMADNVCGSRGATDPREITEVVTATRAIAM